MARVSAAICDEGFAGCVRSMQLASEKERDALSDGISQLLAKLKAKGKGKMGEQNAIPPQKAKGASPVELAARRSLLSTNKCDQPPSLLVHSIRASPLIDSQSKGQDAQLIYTPFCVIRST
jgi:hypothetical protein